MQDLLVQSPDYIRYPFLEGFLSAFIYPFQCVSAFISGSVLLFFDMILLLLVNLDNGTYCEI
jgi:hypothetical protein